MLLFGVAVVGAILAWLLDPGWKIFGMLIGLAALPVMLAHQNAACLVGTGGDNVLVYGCPGTASATWTYYAVALVLFSSGALLGQRGATAH